MGTLISNIKNNPEKQTELTSGNIPSAASKINKVAKDAIPSFSETGLINSHVYQLSKKMNPFRALFNCPITSYKTAYLLETGQIPKVDLKNPNMPHPMCVKSVIDAPWADPLFCNFPPNREYIYIKTCSKATLDMIMQNLGNKTHAIVAADRKGLPFGHIWNYVFDSEREKFIVLDSYSKSYHKNGIENPEKFFNKYNTADLEVAIFFERTPANLELIRKIT